MQYQTIVSEMILEHSELYAKLTASKSLLSTITQLARELRENHLAIIEQLWEVRPGTSELQVRAEAMEIALEELKQSIAKPQAANDSEPISLDALMNYVKLHTPQN